MKKVILFYSFLFLIFSLSSCTKAKNEPVPKAPSEQQAERSEEEKEVSMPSETKSNKPMFVEGEVLVKFKPEVNQEEIAKIIKEEYGCEVLDIIKGLNVYRLKIPKGKTVTEMVELLNKDSRVKYAEPNIIYRLQL